MTTYQNLYTGSHLIAVGINQYTDPRFIPLGNAETDAQELADILSAPPYGFAVEILLGSEATKRAIQNAMFRLRRTGADDRVLVYFAGHGYTLKNKRGHETGFLACADTLPEQDFTALQLDEVTSLRDQTDAKHIAFIFDACFSGQALGLTRGISEGFLDRRAYQVLSAGAGDQTVADYQSMTQLLLKSLHTPNAELITLSNAGLYIQNTMRANSKGKQIPQFGHLTDSQGGDFVFAFPPTVQPIDELPERLRRALTSLDPDARYFAIDRAEKLLQTAPNLSSNIRVILEEIVAKDKDADVRQRAVDALHSSGTKKPLPPRPTIVSETPNTSIQTQGCKIAVTGETVTTYVPEDDTSDIFGSLIAGDQFPAFARSEDGWYGFFPYVAQAGNTGINRLRWVKQSSVVTVSGACNELLFVTPEQVRADIALEHLAACDITVSRQLDLLIQPEYEAEYYGTVDEGTMLIARVRTKDGWIGVERSDYRMGITELFGLQRLVWLQSSQGAITEGSNCERLEIVNP